MPIPQKKEGAGLKRGAYATHEVEFIEQHCSKLSDEKLGEALNRSPESVKKVREQKLLLGISDAKKQNFELTQSLKTKPFWPTLQEQFSLQELALFQDEWVNIHNQFNGDVSQTESGQVLDLIKLGVLIDRTLKEMRGADIYKKELQELYGNIIGGEKLDPKKDEKLIEAAADISKQIAGIENASLTRIREYQTLIAEKGKILAQLKATRAERVNKATDGKTSFWAFMKLILDGDELVKQGNELAVFNAAVDKEQKRLSQYHQYEDGQIDRVLLNHETVELDEEEKDGEDV